MRWRPRILYLALVIFILSSLAVLYALEQGIKWPAYLAIGGMFVAAVLFILSLIPSRRVDWDRIHTEQRLWESGPLGRSWLRIRQRLSKLWKL